MNAHIKEVIQQLEWAIYFCADSLTIPRLQDIKASLLSIPPQQCECPACLREDVMHGNAVPIDKLKCSCGSDCCDRCLKACSNGKCSVKVCGNCVERCAGCAEPFCKACLEDGYCAECIASFSPREKRQWDKDHAPAYCFEGD